MARSADSQDVAVTPKVEEDMNSGLADWFKVDEQNVGFPLVHEADNDSATEDDSDNADVASDAPDEANFDDWSKPMGKGSTSTRPVSKPPSYLSYSDTCCRTSTI